MIYCILYSYFLHNFPGGSVCLQILGISPNSNSLHVGVGVSEPPYLTDWAIVMILMHQFYFQFILIFAIIDYGQPQYGEYVYPGWAQLIGWLVFGCVIGWIPGVAVYQVCKQKGSIQQVNSKNINSIN